LASPGTEGKGLRKRVGFYPFFIVVLSFLYPFLILLAAKWIKIGFCRYKRIKKKIRKKKIKKKDKKRYPKLMKIQMRIKKGYPGQGQEDKQMIKKNDKEGYPK